MKKVKDNIPTPHPDLSHLKVEAVHRLEGIKRLRHIINTRHRRAKVDAAVAVVAVANVVLLARTARKPPPVGVARKSHRWPREKKLNRYKRKVNKKL